jgi:hypothetical protein
MQKTIYIKDEEVALWNGMKIKAATMGISVSEYLIRGVVGNPVATQNHNDSILERIEAKIDRLLDSEQDVTLQPENKLCEYCDKEHDPRFACLEYIKSQTDAEVHPGLSAYWKAQKEAQPENADLIEAVNSAMKTDAENKAEGQAKLDAKRKGRSIKKDKIEKVKFQASKVIHAGERLEVKFKPNPKGTGKKGKAK